MAGQDDVEPATAGPPPAVSASGTLWDLGASPTTLQEAAGVLRARALRALSAQTAVDDSAQLLITNEEWEGETADRFQRHRRKLTGDLGELGGLLGSTADALDDAAAVLIFNQALLDQEWARIAAIPHTTSESDLQFEPADDGQATSVRNAIAAAGDIRARVDEALALRDSAFRTAQGDAAVIRDTWQPRTVRLLDLNIGQGFGNVPFDSSGTDHGDMDEIGRIITGSGANVVTLQEVFQGDLGRLEEWLDENTDGTWDVHFAAATHKYQHDDAIGETIWNFGDPGDFQPFGNAILVHHGEGIASSAELDELTLNDPGNLGAINPWGQEGRSMEGARIEFTDE